MNKVHRPTVDLVWSTPDPARVIATAARMTYSRKDVSDLQRDITEEEAAASVKAILERRHLSVLRHVSMCFTVRGVSRALSHQLVRHTVGHAYEQRSQHYRVERDPSVVEPETIATDERTSDMYEAAMAGASSMYEALIEAGVPKEDARMVLPNGVETQLIWTANLEAILNFVRVRACRVNCSEIISVAVQVRNHAIKLLPALGPHLGPTCWSQGVCYEGQKFYDKCNRPWHTPTVLWTPSFPEYIELVGTRKLGGINVMEFLYGGRAKEEADGQD